jgi:dethiobiotin synthetase
VIACRPGLGTLNHSALTVEAARRRGLDVVGIVIVGWPAQPAIVERTNPRELARMAPIVGAIPHLEGLDTEHGITGPLAHVAARSLAPALGGGFDAAAFLGSLGQ